MMSNTLLMPASRFRKALTTDCTLRVCALLCWLLMGQTAFAQPVWVHDDNGSELSLPEPARRIITLAPSLTELVFSLGAGAQVVGVMDYSDYPAQARQLPVVGRYDTLDMERIVALQPDLIVAWRSGNPRGALQRLEEMGYPVYIAEPVSLRSIASHIFRLGALTGHHETANELGADFLDQLQALQSEFAEREKISVFYQVWHSPLISVGGRELINDMINTCGGRNIFADLPIGPKVNLEDVLARDPQVILASGSDDSMPQWLDDWRLWPELSAVNHNHLYSIPPDLVQRHSLRALQGLQQMCQYINQAR
jgi:iron complex transport system substrate-binding protein